MAVRGDAGRRREVLVIPDTLEVRVRAVHGEWRTAERLSQGTREQVYPDDVTVR